MSARPSSGLDLLTSKIRQEWLRVLVSVLGAYEVTLATSARPGVDMVGIIGGLLVVAAPWVGRRSVRWAVALLLVGTLPFAVLIWWSLIGPFVAILTLAIGLPVILGGDRNAGQPVPAASL